MIRKSHYIFQMYLFKSLSTFNINCSYSYSYPARLSARLIAVTSTYLLLRQIAQEATNCKSCSINRVQLQYQYCSLTQLLAANRMIYGLQSHSEVKFKVCVCVCERSFRLHRDEQKLWSGFSLPPVLVRRRNSSRFKTLWRLF